MSNGYLIAAGPDLAAAHEISDGFGLDVIDPATVGDIEAAGAALAAAANLGLLLSTAAAQDAAFASLLHSVAKHAQRAQLILVDADARAAFPFLPEAWPAMPLDEARRRSAELVRRRQGAPSAEPAQAPPPVAPAPSAMTFPSLAQAGDPDAPPAWMAEGATRNADGTLSLPPAPEPEPQPLSEPHEEAPDWPPFDEAKPADVFLSFSSLDRDGGWPARLARALAARGLNVWSSRHLAIGPAFQQQLDERLRESKATIALWSPRSADSAYVRQEADLALRLGTLIPVTIDDAPVPTGFETLQSTRLSDDAGIEALADSVVARLRGAPSAEAPVGAAPPAATRHGPPLQAAGPAPAPPQAAAPAAPPKRGANKAAPDRTAPADATAFAPKKLRRGTPEIIQIAIHQPKDLKLAIKAAKTLDPRADVAPQGVGIGAIAMGATVGVMLEAHGGACRGELQRRVWMGDPLSFVFSFEANDEAKQAVLFARVFIDDAQIGALAFRRSISGPAKQPASTAEGARLKRYKRVFLSYSSNDREVVSAIATAYQMAGVDHFWDRTSLKSGEEWSPRLRQEIDRADLFHLCWSKSAAGSQWVEKEAEHALKRRKSSNGKQPDITVQMLDGPPWAPHPPALDSINFDDFVRAAIVGYARGDGQ